MTTLVIYLSAFLLGAMIILIVALAYAIMNYRDRDPDGDSDHP
jgi:hypothetical protein